MGMFVFKSHPSAGRPQVLRGHLPSADGERKSGISYFCARFHEDEGRRGLILSHRACYVVLFFWLSAKGLRQLRRFAPPAKAGLVRLTSFSSLLS